jgi:hypothetical protein
VPVSLVTATLGGEFEVPTIDGGKTRVKVPEGMQTGRRFRLQGKGMPVLRSRQFGDMYVQVVVETPQKLTKRQRELLLEFDRLSSTETQPESSGFFGKVKDFLDGLGAGRLVFRQWMFYKDDVLSCDCHGAYGLAYLRGKDRAAIAAAGAQENCHRAQHRTPHPAV